MGNMGNMGYMWILFIGIVEKKMETTGILVVYIYIYIILGLYSDNGKEMEATTMG